MRESTAILVLKRSKTFSFHDGFSSPSHIDLSPLMYSRQRRGTFACVIKPHGFCALWVQAGVTNQSLEKGVVSPLPGGLLAVPRPTQSVWLLDSVPSLRAVGPFRWAEQGERPYQSKNGTLSWRELFLPYGFCYSYRTTKVWEVFSLYRSVRTCGILCGGFLVCLPNNSSLYSIHIYFPHI